MNSPGQVDDGHRNADASLTSDPFRELSKDIRELAGPAERSPCQAHDIIRQLDNRTLKVWGSILHVSTRKTKTVCRDAGRFCFRRGRPIGRVGAAGTPSAGRCLITSSDSRHRCQFGHEEGYMIPVARFVTMGSIFPRT